MAIDDRRGHAEKRTYCGDLTANGICGRGEIGRRAGFRFLWETIWVRVPSSAPRKGDNFDTKSIEIIALFVAFRDIFTLFSAFDGSSDR